MQKQIFKNIVSEKTLKEAYQYHSMLRENYFIGTFVTEKEMRDDFRKMNENGFNYRAPLLQITSEIFGRPSLNLRRLTPEDRNRVSEYIEEKYEESEFYVSE